MIALFVGAAAILLGIKGFTPGGLPLTKKKNLTGKTAIIIGIGCILLGVAFILDGIWMLNRIQL